MPKPIECTPRRGTMILLIMLVLTGWTTYRDKFRDECAFNAGMVIEHRGNLYCVSGAKVIKWGK